MEGSRPYQNHQKSSLYAAFDPTDEEQQVMRQCASESLWYRSIPFSLATGAVTQAMFARGYLKPSPRFGFWPKYVGAIMVGYMLGKVSYIGECKRRLMNLPGAEERVQQRKIAMQQLGQQDSNNWSLYNRSPASYGSEYQQQRQQRQGIDSGASISPLAPSLDDGPRNQGLDDYYRPSLDSPGADYRPQSVEAPPQGPAEPAGNRSLSYEELRLRNRANYGMAPRAPYERVLPPSPSPQPSYQGLRAPPQSESSGDFDNSGGRKQTNKYGDVWEV